MAMTPPRNSETPPPAERTVDRAARAFFAAVLGFVLGVILDFVVTLTASPGSTPGRYGVAPIVLAWAVTIGLAAVLYRIHHWALYGMLGAYAALFLLLLTSGMFGPYTCFGAYGYPSPP